MQTECTYALFRDKNPIKEYTLRYFEYMKPNNNLPRVYNSEIALVQSEIYYRATISRQN